MKPIEFCCYSQWNHFPSKIADGYVRHQTRFTVEWLPCCKECANKNGLILFKENPRQRSTNDSV